MHLTDSRRLTGANLVSDRPGAAIEVAVPNDQINRVVRRWERHARALLDAVGWREHETRARTYPGGGSFVLGAPIDTLYAATEINEWAWAATSAELADGEPPPALQTIAEQLRAAIAAESNPALLRLQKAAATHNVSFVWDDEAVSVGSGRGAIAWPVEELPRPEAVDWQRVRDVRVLLVTGTNGKTTTVRMLAAIVAAAGKVPGNTSTDGVQVGGELVLVGDYTGGEGARTVLRDPRVDVAILEVARGGLLRRGLPVERADAALVSNVGEDHLGEYGVCDLETLARVKLLVGRALGPRSELILNADDDLLVRTYLTDAPSELRQQTRWLTVNRSLPHVAARVREAGGYGMEDGWLCSWLTSPGSSGVFGANRSSGEREGVASPLAGDSSRVIRVDEIPATLEGAATHNVYNALGAMALAHSIEIGADVIADGLRNFASDSRQNPGRGNLFELGGVRVYADFAHNPHGLRTVIEMAGRLPRQRLAILLGQAGDRDNESIDALASIAWRAHPDLVILKEMTAYLRGRESGEVVARLESALHAAGAPRDHVQHVVDEMAAVRQALAWARPGDLVLLLLHARRGEALELLVSLQANNWAPGNPIPGA